MVNKVHTKNVTGIKNKICHKGVSLANFFSVSSGNRGECVRGNDRRGGGINVRIPSDQTIPTGHAATLSVK